MVRFFIVALLLLVSSPQAYSQPTNPQSNGGKAAPATKAHQKAANGRNYNAQGCPGTEYPRLKCEAISAQAAAQSFGQSVDQARTQNRLFTAELIISALTAAAAIAAAGFAARAANAARKTVDVLSDVERANIVLTLENFRDAHDYGPYVPETGTMEILETWREFDLVANNIGRSSALITNAVGQWAQATDPADKIVFSGKNKKYIVPAGGKEILDTDNKSRMTYTGLGTHSYFWAQVTYKAPLLRRHRIIRQRFRVLGEGQSVPYTDGDPEEWDQTGEWDYTKHEWVPFPQEQNWLGEILAKCLQYLHVSKG